MNFGTKPWQTCFDWLREREFAKFKLQDVVYTMNYRLEKKKKINNSSLFYHCLIL